MRFTERKRSSRFSIIITLIGAFALMLGVTAAPVHASHTAQGDEGEGGSGVVHFQGIADPNDGVCEGDPDQGPPEFADGNHLGDPDDGKDGACLPVFPDPNGVDGDFDGDVTASASGIDDRDDNTQTDIAWSVAHTGRIDADFSYGEDPAECPLTGEASGTFEIDGEATGEYNDGSGRVVARVHAHGTFEWARVVDNAAIAFSIDVWIEFDDGSTEHVLDDAGGTATATFQASGNAANCDGSTVTATVIGDGTFSS